jgi:hypothetical protein
MYFPLPIVGSDYYGTRRLPFVKLLAAKSVIQARVGGTHQPTHAAGAPIDFRRAGDNHNP